MMKQLLLSTLLVVSFAGIQTVNAQCTPDPLATDTGYTPEPMSTISNAVIDSAYDETFTLITVDTMCLDFNQINTLLGSAGGFGTLLTLLGAANGEGATGGPGCFYVSIDSIRIDSVSGLPTGMNYSCDAASCYWSANDTGAVCIGGTPTNNNDAGDTNIAIITSYRITGLRIPEYSTEIFPGVPITIPGIDTTFQDPVWGPIGTTTYPLKVLVNTDLSAEGFGLIPPSDTSLIKLTVSNNGVSTASSFDIEVSLEGNPIDTISYTGAGIASATEADVTLGYFDFASGTNNFCAKIINYTGDEVSSNDESCTIILGTSAVKEQANLIRAIYPNPAKDQVQFTLSENLSNTQLMVFDLVGNLVQQHAVSGNRFEISTANLSNGLYVFSFTTTKGVQRGRIEVMH